MGSEQKNCQILPDFDLNEILSKTDSSLDHSESCYLIELARKTHATGDLVHIGNLRSASLYCLAAAAKTWGGVVSLIHTPKGQMTGGSDHDTADSDEGFLPDSLRNLGLNKYLEKKNHKLFSSSWSTDVDYLFIDWFTDKESLIKVILVWKNRLSRDGVIAFNNANGIVDMDRAIDETLYTDSRFIEIGGVGRIRAFRKHSGNLELILCSGLQSGGTTLVSWCFLQRPDMSGILDMSSDVIQLMPYLDTPLGWCKITTSCFRWDDVADFFRDQGWVIRPLLVVRDVREAYCSLRTKPYGLNGMTAEDPPLRLRFRRFLRDWEQFRANGWPIIRFESLLADPVVTLQDCCKQLGIRWYDDMIDWPKPIDNINGVELANITFRTSLSSEGLQKSIIPKNKLTHLTEISANDLEWLENTFLEYNQENNYSLHNPSVEFESAPDRPSFFVSKRHTQPSERAVFLKRIAHCNAELAKCKGRLAAVFDSKSWKITKPLRKAQDFLQRLLGR